MAHSWQRPHDVGELLLRAELVEYRELRDVREDERLATQILRDRHSKKPPGENQNLFATLTVRPTYGSCQTVLRCERK